LVLEDLGSAYEYIAADSPSAAASVIDRIESASNSLRRYANLGRDGRVSGRRELIVTGTPFILPYRVVKGRVEILALIHTAQRWPETF
jgi:toxin ParE1/3/4